MRTPAKRLTRYTHLASRPVAQPLLLVSDRKRDVLRGVPVVLVGGGAGGLAVGPAQERLRVDEPGEREVCRVDVQTAADRLPVEGDRPRQLVAHDGVLVGRRRED